MWKVILVLGTAVLWTLVSLALNPNGDPNAFAILFLLGMMLGAVAVLAGEFLDIERKDRKR